MFGAIRNANADERVIAIHLEALKAVAGAVKLFILRATAILGALGTMQNTFSRTSRKRRNATRQPWQSIAAAAPADALIALLNLPGSLPDFLEDSAHQPQAKLRRQSFRLFNLQFLQ